MTDAHVSPDAARSLIAAAERGTERGDAVAARAWLGPAASVLIGALVGAFLLVGVYLLPTATATEALLLSGGYALGILIAVTVYNLGRTATPRGWLQRYSKGVAISFAIFAIALALSFLTDERSLLLWLPLAIAAALPVAVLGMMRVRR